MFNQYIVTMTHNMTVNEGLKFVVAALLLTFSATILDGVVLLLQNYIIADFLTLTSS